MPSTAISDIAALSAAFEREGYLALEGYFPSERIDRTSEAMSRVLTERPNEIVVDSCATGRRAFWSRIGESETRHFKFNDFYLVSGPIRELALDPGLTALMRALLGQAPVLCNSLNFEKGSSQPKHIDSLYMTPQTPHALAATWIALEDVHPDSGPLSYFPGSHRIPLFRFRDGSHHATPEEQGAWNNYIEAQLRDRNLPERIFLARKGDVFLWHSDLVHGGSPIKDPNRTRKSLVCHYFTEADARLFGTELAPLNGGFWFKRLRHPVRMDPAEFGPEFPFPEETYLARYADVAEAVRTNACPSGRYHYETFGHREGRGV
ncbi:MAG: phytanoyl-CoA dioxygenase family protein [Opitutaceae bacterium]